MKIDIKNAGFQLPDLEPQKFTQCKWTKDHPKSTIYYLLYKCFLVLFLFTHQITHFWYKIVKQKQGEKYYLYLTRQGFTLLLVALFLDACLVLLRYFEEQKNKNDSENQENVSKFQRNHFKLKLSMGLTNTTYTLALVITLLYWIFVFPKTDAKEPADAYLNIVVHLFQTIIVLLDIMISNRPWNIWHLWCPMLYSIVYLIFNVIYVVPFEGLNPKGFPWIYKILDWNKNLGRSVLMSIGLIFVAVPLTSVALHFLTKFRDFLWAKKNKNSKVQPKGETEMNSFEKITNSRINVVI